MTKTIVVLEDGETWTELKGCHIVEIEGVSSFDDWDGYDKPVAWAQEHPDQATATPMEAVFPIKE